MGETSIEWAEHSINPIRARHGDAVGHYCEKVSPGCARCYASTLQRRFRMPQFQHQRGEAVPFLDAKKLDEVLRRRKPTAYFWCDMTDMFGEWVPNEWIAACFGVMAATPQHTHQVLTKRADRMREWFKWIERQHTGLVSRKGPWPNFVCTVYAQDVFREDGLLKSPPQFAVDPDQPWPLPNVWLGVSVEDQRRADERIPHLLQTPAAVRFLSCEPLLGPVDLTRVAWEGTANGHVDVLRGGTWSKQWGFINHSDMPATIDWAIIGSESGNGAREMRIEWAESIRDQCKAAEVACFTKQIATAMGRAAGDRKGGDPQHWPGGATAWPRQTPGARR